MNPYSRTIRHPSAAAATATIQSHSFTDQATVASVNDSSAIFESNTICKNVKNYDG